METDGPADDTDVISAHLRPLTRRTTALAALVLFLSGSNYCLIGALRGTPMACTAIAGVTAATADDAAASCPRHAGRTDTSTPAPAGAAPCCVTIAPVSAPEVSRVDATVALLPVVAALAATIDLAPPAQALHAPPADEASPAAAWDDPAHAGRAPPLS